MQGLGLHCERCGSRMRIRTSRRLHPYYSRFYLECSRPACDYRCRGDFTVQAVNDSANSENRTTG
ncbi:ogr/Delta-like zinc finger family protein [Kushneria avicenniae]|uniref:ogr/Delta-like zinc finger family protein n=1 Tax=Kushneria avicenniae TaxID=402385 RepID=UPI000B7F121E